MRVTHRFISQNMNQNLQAALRRLNTQNEHISTGKRITAPSEDPSGMEASMRLRSSLNKVDQYLTNIGTGLSWLEATDLALAQAGEGLNRVRELALYGVNGVLDSTERQALAKEVEGVLNDLMQIGNTQFGDRYLFGGVETTQPPFRYTSDYEYVGSAGPSTNPNPNYVSVEISEGISIDLSVHGDEVIMPIIKAVDKLRQALLQDDIFAISESVGDIDQAQDSLLQWRAVVGANTNRLNMAENRLSENRINIKTVLSKHEDVDLAEAIMELKIEESIYRSALAASARIIQPTLLDFLR
jgi:flagellar hook-associated protein 3 FlgL